MPGFMSNSTALTLCKADPAKLSPNGKREKEHPLLPFDVLKAHAFTPEIQADGVRLGWVGLGSPLDYDFNFGLEVSSFPAFSLRVDTRKASAAAVKLLFAETLLEKEANGEKITGKDRKDLKEAITAKLTSQAPFIPTLTDCIWDMSSGRLFLSTISAKSIEAVFSLFQKTFGILPQALTPKNDLTAVFAEICRTGEFSCAGYSLTPFGTASLATSQQEEDKALIAVQNNLHAVSQALDEGLRIQKLRLVATSADFPDLPLDFTLDASLGVSGLILPKSEKSADQIDDYFLKLESYVGVAAILEALAAL